MPRILLPSRYPGYLNTLLFLIVAVGSVGAAGQTNGSMRGSFSVPTSNSSAASGLTTVIGVVTNAVNGLPVSRALVRLNDRAILTDHEGKFEFDQFRKHCILNGLDDIDYILSFKDKVAEFRLGQPTAVNCTQGENK